MAKDQQLGFSAGSSYNPSLGPNPFHQARYPTPLKVSSPLPKSLEKAFIADEDTFCFDVCASPEAAPAAAEQFTPPPFQVQVSPSDRVSPSTLGHVIRRSPYPSRGRTGSLNTALMLGTGFAAVAGVALSGLITFDVGRGLTSSIAESRPESPTKTQPSSATSPTLAVQQVRTSTAASGPTRIAVNNESDAGTRVDAAPHDDAASLPDLPLLVTAGSFGGAMRVSDSGGRAAAAQALLSSTPRDVVAVSEPRSSEARSTIDTHEASLGASQDVQPGQGLIPTQNPVSYGPERGISPLVGGEPVSPSQGASGYDESGQKTVIAGTAQMARVRVQAVSDDVRPMANIPNFDPTALRSGAAASPLATLVQNTPPITGSDVPASELTLVQVASEAASITEVSPSPVSETTIGRERVFEDKLAVEKQASAAALHRRARDLLHLGDVAAAQLFLQRAAELGFLEAKADLQVHTRSTARARTRSKPLLP